MSSESVLRNIHYVQCNSLITWTCFPYTVFIIFYFLRQWRSQTEVKPESASDIRLNFIAAIFCVMGHAVVLNARKYLDCRYH